MLLYESLAPFDAPSSPSITLNISILIFLIINRILRLCPSESNHPLPGKGQQGTSSSPLEPELRGSGVGGVGAGRGGGAAVRDGGGQGGRALGSCGSAVYLIASDGTADGRSSRDKISSRETHIQMSAGRNR